MIFCYNSSKKNFSAVLNVENGKYILKKGSTVSATVSEHFKTCQTVKKRRIDARIADDNYTQNQDIEFSSS